MTRFICTACGTQFADSEAPPSHCPICEDERQFVPEGGQEWTSLDRLAAMHTIDWGEEASGVHSLRIEPSFAIGQRAFFIEHAQGNVLWDCLSLVDDDSMARIERAGGLAAIAISHPHFYTAMVEWSRALSDVPIYLHADDAKWVERRDPAIRFWEGESVAINEGAGLVRCGGHFEGSSVLHCPDFAGGKGALFTGDTLQVVADRRHVSFMRSFPNIIPLPAAKVEAIAGAVRPLAFDTIFGGFPGRTIESDAKAAVERSVRRYIEAIGGGDAG